MKKIVISLKPTETQHKIYVFEDNTEKALCFSNTEELANRVMALALQYNITQIELAGAKKYATGVKNNLERAALNKFGEKVINIKIISAKGDK